MKWGWLKKVGTVAYGIAKEEVPGVGAVEAGVKSLKAAKGPEKLVYIEAVALAVVGVAEQVAQKDLLEEPEVAMAYRGFLAAYWQLLQAVGHARAVRVVPPVDPVV